MDTKEALKNHRNVSQKTVKWISRSSIITMIIVALSSAILSFEGLQSLALASRVPPELAFLFPITIDTTILMGSLAVLRYELVGMKTMFGWFTVLFGTALSVVGNVISVSEGGLTAQILHGIIPILLCISLESLLRILRFNIKTSVVELANAKPMQGDTVETDLVEDEIQPNPVESILSSSIEKVEVSRNAITETPEIEAQSQSKHIPAVQPELVADVNKETVDNKVSSTPIYDAIPAETTPVESVVANAPSFENGTDIPATTQNIETKTETHSSEQDLSEHPQPVEMKNMEAKSTEPPITEAKTPAPTVSTAKKKPTSRNASTLTEKEREKFKIVATKYLSQGHSASKVLAQVLKVNDKLTGSDIRYIMGYDSDKRIDGIVSRARKLAKGE